MNQWLSYWQRYRSRRLRIDIDPGSVPLALLLCLLVSCAGAKNPSTTPTANRPTQPATSISTSPTTSTAGSNLIHHYEYVFPDGGMYVYDMDHQQALIQSISLPTTAGVRGVAASPVTHMLYVSYGSDSGAGGSLLKYDLVASRIVWQKTYEHGIDSMAITPGGKTIYMPDGELSSDGKWYIVDANTGNDTGFINAGKGPHNTIVSLDGKRVYMGGRFYPHVEVADTATQQIIHKIGPLQGDGVRPFTINGKETLAFMSTTGFLGFQVGDIASGKILCPGLG